MPLNKKQKESMVKYRNSEKYINWRNNNYLKKRKIQLAMRVKDNNLMDKIYEAKSLKELNMLIRENNNGYLFRK